MPEIVVFVNFPMTFSLYFVVFFTQKQECPLLSMVGLSINLIYFRRNFLKITGTADFHWKTVFLEFLEPYLIFFMKFCILKNISFRLKIPEIYRKNRFLQSRTQPEQFATLFQGRRTLQRGGAAVRQENANFSLTPCFECCLCKGKWWIMMRA